MPKKPSIQKLYAGLKKTFSLEKKEAKILAKKVRAHIGQQYNDELVAAHISDLAKAVQAGKFSSIEDFSQRYTFWLSD